MTTRIETPKTTPLPARQQTSPGIRTWRRRIPLLPTMIFTIVVTHPLEQ